MFVPSETNRTEKEKADIRIIEESYRATVAHQIALSKSLGWWNGIWLEDFHRRFGGDIR